MEKVIKFDLILNKDDIKEMKAELSEIKWSIQEELGYDYESDAIERINEFIQKYLEE